MKKLIFVFLVITVFSMIQAFYANAYDTIFESDGSAPFSSAYGTVVAIFDPNDEDTASTTISAWKSVKVQATATATVTHFLIKISGNMSGVNIGFGVLEGYSDDDTHPGSLLVSGVYSSYTFDQGAGWYSIPFTADATLSVTSGDYFYLTFYESGEAANFARGNNISPFPSKWGDSAAAAYDDIPEGSDWDVHYEDTSAPWLMGLLSTGGGSGPGITSIESATVYHGGTLKIYDTNEGFGSKNPAAPLWWDNMEGASNESTTFTSGELSWVISGVLSGTDKHYSEAIPNAQLDTASDMTYRSVGYRSVDGPHDHSTLYASAAHYQPPDNDPWYDNAGYKNIALTVDSGAADKDTWFAHFYYRVDPNWTSIGGDENHKKTAINVGTTIYGSQPNQYMASSGSNSEGDAVGDVIEYAIANLVTDYDNCTMTQLQTGANAKNSWVAIEQHNLSSGNLHEIWSWDGGATGSGKKSWTDTSDDDCAGRNDNARSYSVGGWYCTDECLSTDDLKRGHVDNFRYYDDLYVDNTFSRVVLANDSTYADATIVEPQIPSAWAVGEITVTVNQGSLPNGTAYLFVFDSDNVANDTGYPITLSDQYPPTISGCVFK